MPIRGSSFNNTSNGGAGALNLNNARSNVNNNVSLRSASPFLPAVVPTSGHVQCVWVFKVLCTDISRDGMLQGPSVELYQPFFEKPGIFHGYAAQGYHLCAIVESDD